MNKNKIMVVVFVGLTVCGMVGQAMAEDAESLLGQADKLYGERQLFKAASVYQAIVTSYPGSSCVAKAQEALDVIKVMVKADELNGYRNYSEAENLYNSIISGYPGSDHALVAKKKIINIYLATGRHVEAEALFVKMVEDFASNEQLPVVIHEIGDGRLMRGMYDQAKYYYNYVLEHWVGSDMAVWSQKNIVKTCIKEGNEPEAQQELDELKSGFAGHAKLPEAFYSIAEGYAAKKQYDKAEACYNYVIETWPENEAAVQSHKNIVKIYIANDNNQKAQQELDELKSKFAGHLALPQALHSIAGGYIEKKNYVKANELNQYIAEQWPDSEQGLLAHKSLAETYITMGDKQSAQVWVDGLLSNAEYKGLDGYPQVVMCVAGRYREFEAYDKAEELYRYLINEYPNYMNKMYTFEGLIVCHIWLRDDPDDAETASEIASFKEGFSGRFGYSWVMYQIGRGYYYKGEAKHKEKIFDEAEKFYGKGLDMFDLVVKEPGGWEDCRGRSYVFRAACHSKCEQLYKAIDDYQVVAEFWPRHRWAAHAQYMVGVTYNKLREREAAAGDTEGAADDENAMAWAYDAVIANYPDTSYALQASKEMGLYRFKQRQWAEAVEYLEQWHQRQPEVVHVQDMLEECHEQLSR